MPTIKFSVDGGLTFQEATEGVRIIYEGVDIPGEDGTGELHLNATHEGLISDLWTTREDPLDHNIGTSSQMIEDLVSDLVDDPVDAADQTVTLNLYIFDDAGDVVDDATATLTVEQLSDVVDHASQLIRMNSMKLSQWPTSSAQRLRQSGLKSQAGPTRMTRGFSLKNSDTTSMKIRTSPASGFGRRPAMAAIARSI